MLKEKKWEIDKLFYKSMRKTNAKKLPLEMKYVKFLRKYNNAKIKIFYKIMLKFLSCLTGIQIPYSLDVGYGLMIGHRGTIVINSNTHIGNFFVVSCGVVIGADFRGKRKGVPTIGNQVCIHSNSVLVGKISIGNDVLIAPNTFVNFDVPDHSIVIGNPAKIISRNNATECHIILPPQSEVEKILKL